MAKAKSKTSVFAEDDDLIGDETPSKVIEDPVETEDAPPLVDEPDGKEDNPDEPTDVNPELITAQQQDGRAYFVWADDPDLGVPAFYRRTRIMLHTRWRMKGEWVDPITRKPIGFVPTRFKAIEYPVFKKEA